MIDISNWCQIFSVPGARDKAPSPEEVLLAAEDALRDEEVLAVVNKRDGYHPPPATTPDDGATALFRQYGGTDAPRGVKGRRARLIVGSVRPSVGCTSFSVHLPGMTRGIEVVRIHRPRAA